MPIHNRFRSSKLLACLALTFVFVLTLPLAGWSQVKKSAVVQGDFSSFSKTADSQCPAAGPKLALCVEVLGDGDVVIAEADAVSVSDNKISITYTALPSDKPKSIRVGKNSPPDVTYPFVLVASPGQAQLVDMRQIVAGDFCQKDRNCDCTTVLLKPPAPGSCNATGDPNHGAQTPDQIVKSAFVEDAGHTQYSATVNSIGVDTVDISFSAPVGFKPANLGIATAEGPYRFAFMPAPPIQTMDLVYTSDKLSDICKCVKSTNAGDACGGAKNSKPDCVSTTSNDVALQSLSSSAAVVFEGVQDNLLVARVTAPMGLEPNALIVTNTTNKTSVMARRTVKPGQNNNELQVELSIMDQESVARNYGTRTSKRYYAINPGCAKSNR